MYERRLRRLLIGFSVLLGAVALHISLLQVFRLGNLAARIDATHPFGIRARRGEIHWADGTRMAWNVPGYGLEIRWNEVDDRLVPTAEQFRAAIADREERERQEEARALAREGLERRRIALAADQETRGAERRKWRSDLVARLERDRWPRPGSGVGTRWECTTCRSQTKHVGPPVDVCTECGVRGEWRELPALTAEELASLLEIDVYSVCESLILALGRRAEHPTWRSHAFRVTIPAHAAEAIALTPRHFAGFEPLPRTSRAVDPAAALVVGSTRLPGRRDFAELRRPSRQSAGLHVYEESEIYPLLVGASLLERRHDELLRGVPGRAERVRLSAAAGESSRVDILRPVQDGEDLHTTLRGDLQTRALEIVARAPEGGHGAAVVIDVRDGSVLALASTTRDGMNRARSHVTPGSVYKIVTAVAALEAGIGPEVTRECRGRGRVEGGGRYACMHTDGDIALVEAFAHSCNGYFAQQAAKAGMDAMVSAAERLGLGERHLVDELGTDQAGIGGLPATREGLRDWYRPDLPFLGIGQGRFGSATPLQIAVAYARIANGGRLVRPWLLARDRPDPATIPVDALLARWSPLLRDAARLVVTAGTAAGVPGLAAVGAAGKTGTAEVDRDVAGVKVRTNNAWFVGFAPYDAPRYCVVVVFEGVAQLNYGGEVCGAPVAELLAEALVAQ